MPQEVTVTATREELYNRSNYSGGETVRIYQLCTKYLCQCTVTTAVVTVTVVDEDVLRLRHPFAPTSMWKQWGVIHFPSRAEATVTGKVDALDEGELLVSWTHDEDAEQHRVTRWKSKRLLVTEDMRTWAPMGQISELPGY